MGVAPDGDAHAVRTRELHLDPVQHTLIVGDQVVVAVLAERDRDAAAAFAQIAGDLQLRQTPSVGSLGFCFGYLTTARL
jgi:hypothetical protein